MTTLKTSTWKEWSESRIRGVTRIETLRRSLDQRKMSMLFGSGLTAGLLSSVDDQSKLPKLSIESWEVLLNGLSKEPGGVSSSGSPKDDELEVAFRLRRRLTNCGQWPTALKATIDPAIAEAWKRLSTADFKRTAWGSVIEALKKATSENRAPLVFTTNYDDLLARLLGWQILFFPDKRQSPPGTSPSVPPGRRTEIRSPEGGELASSLRELQRLEDFIGLYESGWMQPNQHFVVHLHGWHEEKDSMVFDPGNYEVLQKEVFEPIAIRFLAPNRPFLIIGMGAGLFDPHFARYLCDGARPTVEEGASFSTNLWFLRENDLGEIERRANEFAINLTRLEIVTFAKFSDLPNLLLEIVQPV